MKNLIHKSLLDYKPKLYTAYISQLNIKTEVALRVHKDVIEFYFVDIDNKLVQEKNGYLMYEGFYMSFEPFKPKIVDLWVLGSTKSTTITFTANGNEYKFNYDKHWEVNSSLMLTYANDLIKAAKGVCTFEKTRTEGSIWLCS